MSTKWPVFAHGGRGLRAVLAVGLLCAAVVAFPAEAQAATAYDWAQTTSDVTPARSAPAVAAEGTTSSASVLLFGGKSASGVVNDTWRWNGSAWSKLTPSASPTARSGAAVVYDPIRRQTVLFGGNGATGLLGDTWTWNGTTWTKLAPAGSPAARQDATVVWDPVRKLVTLFGGTGTTGKLQDTWTWNGSTWTQAAPAAKPPARSGAAGAFDPASATFILFGGAGKTGLLADTWRWNGTTWAQLGMSTSPSARSGARAEVSAAAGQLVLFGGTGTTANNETWLFAATTWTKLAPAHVPAARESAGLAATADGALLLAGGGSGATPVSGSWLWRTAPGAPQSVTATAQNRQATVNWTAPLTGGAPITSYTVTASPGGATATATAPTATVTGLQPGTSYTFTVTAANAVGTGSPSAASTAVTTWSLPGAPRSVSAVPGDAAAVVSWQVPASDGGSPITGYTITPVAGGTALPATTAGPAATSAAVGSLTNGTAYTFAVTATTAAGTGPAGTTTTVTPTSVPSAPRSVTAASADRAAAVSWQPPASDGGSPITGYTITPYTGSGALTATTVGATATTISVPGLTRGTTYTFTVVASNARGSSPASAPSNAVAPWDLPGAPRAVTASPGDGRLTVSWQPPATDGGTPVTGYTVTMSSGTTVQSTTTVSAGTTSTVATGLTNDQQYSVAVSAANAAGTGPQANASAVVSNRPSAPQAASAAQNGADRIVVSWQPPASDGGSPVTAYRVTPYQGTTALTSITTAAGAVTITGLTGSTPYTFTVVAINANGAGPAASSSAKTPMATCPTGTATNVWTGLAGSLDWADPGNWSAGRLPADTDVACLPAATLGSGPIAVPATTVRQLITYKPLVLNVGLTTLDGADFFADATWTGGTLTGARITIAAGTTTTVTGQVTLAGTMAVTNSGIVRIDGVTAPLGLLTTCDDRNAVSWVNPGTLLFARSTGGSVSICSGSFTNTGTVSHTATGRDALFAGRLTSSGLVTAAAGVLIVYSGSLTGGTVGGGAGHVVLDGALTTTPDVSVGDNVWVTGSLIGTAVVSAGATLHVGYDAAYPAGARTAGTLTGRVTGGGALAVTGHRYDNWPNGSLESQAVLAADLDLPTVSLGDYTTLAAKPDGAATAIGAAVNVKVAGAVTIADRTTVTNNGTVDVVVGHHADAPPGGLVHPCGTPNSAAWTNAGSLVISAPSGGASVSLCSGTFVNTGSITHTGTGRDVLYAEQLTSSGSIGAPAGVFVVYSGALTGGRIGGGPGQVVLENAVTTTSAVTIGDNVWVTGSLSGTAVVPAGDTLHVGYDPASPAGGRFAGTLSGRVTGAGALSITGHEYNNWPNGVVDSQAILAADLEVPTVTFGDFTTFSRKPDGTPTRISATTAVNVAGYVTFADPVSVINDGAVDITVGAHPNAPGGGLVQPCGTTQSVSWLNAGTLTISDPEGGAVSLCSGTFTNTGTILHAGFARDLLTAEQFTNTGSITSQAGALLIYSGALVGGTVAGDAGQVILDGTVSTTPAVTIGDNVWVTGSLIGTTVVPTGATLHVGYNPDYPAQTRTAGTVAGTVTGGGRLATLGREYNNWPNGSVDSRAVVAADLQLPTVVLGDHTTLAHKPDGTATTVTPGTTVTLSATPLLEPGLTLRNRGELGFGTNGYFACADCALVNENTGTLRLDNPDGNFTHGFTIDSGTFDNAGLIRLTGFLPGTWVSIGSHVTLTGSGAGRVVTDGLRQPSWIQNLRSPSGVAPFASALTQTGLTDLASNALMAGASAISSLGLGKCVNVNAGIGVAGAGAGVCLVFDSHGKQALVLSVAGSATITVDRSNPFELKSIFGGGVKLAADAGGQALWTAGAPGPFSVDDDLDGLSWCQTGILPVAEVGITGQHCWGPKDGIAFEPKAFSLTEPGVHSIYAGAVVGGATPDLSLSLSYSVTIGCGEWYSLTLQLCAPANQVPPSISGTPAVGKTATASPGQWASGGEGPEFDLTYRYEWQRLRHRGTVLVQADRRRERAVLRRDRR